MFLQFLEAGLAYRAKSPVDWCPNDGTLAREQVEGADRHCWRCGALVEKRDLEQWYLRTTTYADELLDFAGIEWPEPIRIMQTNWIGRSEGAEIDFTIAADDHQAGGEELRVFTTRPDTLFGATFMVLAPEHPLVATPDRARTSGPRWTPTSSRRAARPRSSGSPPTARRPASPSAPHAINPVNGERIPIFIADYVLSGYGTGAIMAVPAHDERDFAFATKFGLPIRRGHRSRPTRSRTRRDSPTRTSRTPTSDVLVNSGRFDGLPGARRAPRRSSQWLAARGRRRARGHVPTARLAHQPPALLGHAHPGRLLRDRRHRAGARTRICRSACPRRWTTPGSGDNPLSHDEAFLHATCPRCGGPARRETDTMDTFIDSSWYWFRYLSPDHGDRPGGPGDGRSLDAGGPVHRRRRARRHAPAVQPLLHQGDARHAA